MTLITKDFAEELAAALGDFRGSADTQFESVIRRAIDFAERVAAEKTPLPPAGFRVSLTGVLRRAAENCNRYQAFGLDELLKHLRELRDRRLEGTRVLEEFFALYVIQDERVTA